MFITQTSKTIDSLIGPDASTFEVSNLYAKIKNLVYLPVVKDSANAGDWYFTHCIHIQVEPGSVVFERLKADYDAIRFGLIHHVSTSKDGFIHTTNGVNTYLQVRSKDSKPYYPIYSAHFDRYISNKNHAFYFMKPFLRDAVMGAFEL
jgi:DNA mismatch repair protein MutH